MILGIALVLTLLQVGVSLAMPSDATSLNNPVEQSVHILQNFLHEVRATNQREFASQQHRPRNPTATNPHLGATSPAMYIQQYGSGLVFEYKPNNEYQLVIEPHSSSNTNQQFYVIESGFPEYYYISNSTVSPFMRVMAAGATIATPVFLTPMVSGLARSQLWFLRQPVEATEMPNPSLLISNVATGLVMTVGSASPGSFVRVNNPSAVGNKQYYFYN